MPRRRSWAWETAQRGGGLGHVRNKGYVRVGGTGLHALGVVGVDAVDELRLNGAQALRERVERRDGVGAVGGVLELGVLLADGAHVRLLLGGVFLDACEHLLNQVERGVALGLQQLAILGHDVGLEVGELADLAEGAVARHDGAHALQGLGCALAQVPALGRHLEYEGARRRTGRAAGR